MKSPALYTLAKVVLPVAAFVMLQACTTASPSKVAQAYESSGVIGAAKPYTRTIFSSENF